MSDWMDNLVRDDAGLRAILREAKTVVGTAVDLSVPVDVVEILRRPEDLPGHAREIRALPWRPKALWFQLGVRHDAAAAPLARAGIRVVQDRCMMPEHRRPPELVGSSEPGAVPVLVRCVRVTGCVAVRVAQMRDIARSRRCRYRCRHGAAHPGLPGRDGPAHR